MSVVDSISKIKEVYGARAVETPNYFYNSELTEFTVTSVDGYYAILFGTEEGKVTSIVAGRSKSVAYVEVCL